MIFLRIILILTLVSFSDMTGATSCPTCPKGYVVSRLEEALVSQQSRKGLVTKAKPSKHTLSLNSTKELFSKKAPGQTFMSHTKSSTIAFKTNKPSKRSLEDIREEQNRTQRLIQPPFQSLEGIVRKELQWPYDRKK